MSSSPRVAVIGAGLAGIAAGRRLRERGAEVVVFEKSRGYGGRCASKRWEGQVIDHGAQYFTIRDESFRQALHAACGSRLKVIYAPILSGEGETVPGNTRFYHLEGNSRVARDLAGDLDVRTNCAVSTAEKDGAGWRIGTDRFDRILSTAPLPQTRKLAGLPMGDSEYIPCLALLLLVEGKLSGPSANVYAFSDPAHPVAMWTACENHKEGRVHGGQTVFVVHGSESFSRSWLEAQPGEWAEKLKEFAMTRWALPEEAVAKIHGHRWRYARVGVKVSPPDLPEGWYFAGDALTESRVEAAWLAGWAAADRMEI